MPEPQTGALTTSPYSPWQGRQDSNPRHAVLETAVLPAELRPYLIGGGGRIRTFEASATDLQSAPFGHFGTPPQMEPATGIEPATY